MTARTLIERLDHAAWTMANGQTLAGREMLEAVIRDLRSHEPPRNSGKGTAVDGPMPLGEKPDAVEPA